MTSRNGPSTDPGRWPTTGRTRFGLRQDFIAGRASRANLGLEYRNECILVDLSLSRWFANSTTLTPTTEFGLAVDLLGFGGSGSRRAPRAAAEARSTIDQAQPK